MEAKKVCEEITGENFHFGVILRAYRERHDLTQSDLAERLQMIDIGVSDINKFETKQTLVTVEQAIDIASILNEPEEYYLLVAIQDHMEKEGVNYHPVTGEEECKEFAKVLKWISRHLKSYY